MRKETADILALLDTYTMPNAEALGKKIAEDFRSRRVEKGLTREEIAEKSGVAMSNVARFEQKGLISLTNLIKLGMALGYTAEVKNIFAEPKFSTMEELTQIRKNTGKKKAYPKSKRRKEDD